MDSQGSGRAAGEIFDGQYKLVEELGSGEFGEVWKAYDRRLYRTVALKLLKDNDEDAAWVEGQKLVELKSTNILRIFNAGLAIDVPYLVTEYVEGGSVAELSHPRGIAPRRAVEIMRGVLRGLSLAHQRRILHRDVKPANIFVRGNGDAQLADFGVAAIMDDAGSAKGHGDLDVRAPEVLKGGRATAASDVYSAGVTLWAMLAGDLPFLFDEKAGFAPHRAAVLQGVPAIRDVCPGVSRPLASVVDRACALRSADRFATASDFDDALGRLRNWSADVIAVPTHPGHRTCWQVTRLSDGHVHEVCVVQPVDGGFADGGSADGGSGLSPAHVVVRHAGSGSRVTALCRTARNESAVMVGLRRAFDTLTRP